MIKKSYFLMVYVLLATACLYINVHSDVTVPMNRTFSEFPVTVQTWRMISQDRFSDSVLDVLKPTDSLARSYVGHDGRTVKLYIGYHGGGKNGGEIHSPKHCLPGSGWYETSSKRTSLDIRGKSVRLVEAVYKKGEERELFFYWYQVRDKALTDEYSLKLSEIVNSMVHRRRDASFIRVSVPMKGGLDGDIAVGERFVRDFYPVIMEFLPS
jgi:EpsI family protein